MVNPLQPLEPTLVLARNGLWRTFMRELRARHDVGGKSEPARDCRDRSQVTF
jgi:hypothetical protein